MAGEVKHKDVGPELTYDEYHSADSHTIDGVEAGTVIAGKTTLAEVKADTDMADAISKKHSNALDHTQGTDQGLDTGGLNAVTAAEVKGAVTNSHAPGSDDQDIPTQLSDLSDDENHRLVTDTEKGTWNGKATVADVKADEDVASAISLKHSNALDHASGSDNQDLSGLVPYSGATGDVALGTHSLECAGVSATGNVLGQTIIGDDLILWDTGETPGDPTISMVSGNLANSLTLSTDGTVAEIVSNNKMFHFRTGENIIRFIKSLYEYWFTIDLTGANPQLTSYTGEISFDNENLTTTGNITAATLKATNLSDGKIPYHVDDTNGLADGPVKTDVDSAVSLKHSNASDHTQGTDQGLDTGGDNAVTAAQVKGAVTNSHVAVTVSAPISLSGQALSLVNDADAAITEIDTGALANSDTVIPTSKAVTTAIAGVSAGGSQQLSHGRLTLESGVGVSTTDQTAKTILYYTPYVGNLIGLYSGTAWEDKTFSEIHIDLTETQSCTTVNGDATLTVADTSQLIVGMGISGTNIAGGATIASITDATTLEMSANATGDGTQDNVFKIPASKVVDVFAYNASGSAKLVFGPLWTDGTTRATAITTKDGVPVLSGTYAISGTDYTEGKLRLLGTIKATATAGQTQFTGSSALVTNIFNLIPKVLISYNSNASWTYNGTSKREYNGGTGQVRAEFVMSLVNQSIFMIGAAFAQVGLGETFYCALGYDSTTVFAGTSNFAYYIYTVFGPAMAYRTPAIGYHYMTQLEWANTGNTGTNYGQYGGDGTLYSQAHVTVMI